MTRGRVVESSQKKRGREWPMEERQRVARGKWQRVATEKEAESGQWKRGREWPQKKRKRGPVEK